MCKILWSLLKKTLLCTYCSMLLISKSPPDGSEEKKVCYSISIQWSCNKCHQTHATILHMLWICLSSHLYRTSIFKTIFEVVCQPLALCPFAALFGVLPEEAKMSQLKKDFAVFSKTLNLNVLEEA